MTDSTAIEHVHPRPRLTGFKLAPDVYRAMSAFDQSITLDTSLRELVKLRASILNGCSFCVDMHTTEARRLGETDRRLASVAAWHHAPFFTARERAALALTDAVTRLGPDGVPDDVWAAAAEQFEEPELIQVVWAIAAINTWNRFAIACGSVPPVD